ncbi:MAG: ATP-dependent DNA helicase RecG, partial [Candidatus Amulumruptor sp.]|nr:ATP-dependent DNA helicase RecG [Candidatus Amulumruptor sp.]
MPHFDASTEIKYLKGVGPRRAQLLQSELGIRTYGELVQHFPSSYLDRTSFRTIDSFVGDDMPSVQVRGRFLSFVVQGEGAKTRLVGLFSDGRATMEVIWFRSIKQIKAAYLTNTEYVLFGKPSLFKMTGRWSMVHPEVDLPGAAATAGGGLRGVYPLTERLRNSGISSRNIFTWVQA